MLPVERVSRRWVHCPICDSELVGPYPAGQLGYGPQSLTFEPLHEELVAKCPVHGHRPYNDPTQHPRIRRIAKD
jgi:hypothetical protein